MKVTQVRIKNVLGIEELEFKPGQVTVIEGSNASGKTSILEAFRAAVGGGHDATLLHNGAKEGEIVLVLDDSVEIQKTISELESSVAVVHPDFGAIKKPQTWIDRLSDVLSVNPIQFLTKGKDRLKNLLEVLPLQVTAEQIQSVAPHLSEEDIKEIDCSKHGLVVLASEVGVIEFPPEASRAGHPRHPGGGTSPRRRTSALRCRGADAAARRRRGSAGRR